LETDGDSGKFKNKLKLIAKIVVEKGYSEKLEKAIELETDGDSGTFKIKV
jgi:hypothetical protein